MTPKQVAHILATLNKLKIEANPNLDRIQKEFYKWLIDKLKKQM